MRVLAQGVDGPEDFSRELSGCDKERVSDRPGVLRHVDSILVQRLDGRDGRDPRQVRSRPDDPIIPFPCSQF